ncbi:ABC transporter substrate-binding protein [Miniphocaeibacter massiliensis]|uniref:ABC transporter substrate-binding protein n=1 Tax=Miniphocaeibacter massiliensis TaxID=2041841 RepID=UPI0013EB1C6F|nr:ABC transporter substrate-binding protein [Miniphocaeibacter massiliensis]
MRKFKIIILTILCLLLTACGNNSDTNKTETAFDKERNEFIKRASYQEKLDDKLIFGMVGEPENLNPFYYKDNSSKTIVNTLYQPLLRIEEANYKRTLDYELLDNLVISEDGLIYTLSLKNGITWHDGTPLTVDDVIYTINYINSNKDTRYLDAFIVDGSPVTVEKVDGNTLNIKLPRISDSFIYNLEDLLVVPEHIFKEDVPKSFTAKDKKYLVGNSSYKFKDTSVDEYFNTDDVNFVKNEEFYGDVGKISNLKYRIIAHQTTTRFDLLDYNIQGGYILGTDTPSVGRELYNTKYLKDGKVYSLMFKLNTKNGGNKEIRTAVSNTINYYSLLGNFGDDTNTSIANSVFSQNNIYRVNNSSTKSDSAENSIEYLKKLQEEDKDFALRYGFILDAGEMQEKVAIYIQELFVINGLNIELVPLYKDEYYKLLEDPKQDKIDFCLYSYDSEKNPQYYKNLFSTNAPLNYAGYSNEKLDSLWSKADNTKDTFSRIKTYSEIQDIIMEDKPIFPMFYVDNIVAIDERVQNIDKATANSTSFFNHLNLLSIKEFSYSEKDLEKYNVAKSEIKRQPQHDNANIKSK